VRCRAGTIAGLVVVRRPFADACDAPTKTEFQLKIKTYLKAVPQVIRS